MKRRRVLPRSAIASNPRTFVIPECPEKDCGQKGVRFRGAWVCPVHFELATGRKKLFGYEKKPIGELMPNRRARRRA